MDKVGPFSDMISVTVLTTNWLCVIQIIIFYCWTMINVVVSMSSNYQVCVTILKICFIICIMVRCCEHLSPQTLRPGKIPQHQDLAAFIVLCIMMTWLGWAGLGQNNDEEDHQTR